MSRLTDYQTHTNLFNGECTSYETRIFPARPMCVCVTTHFLKRSDKDKMPAAVTRVRSTGKIFIKKYK